MRKIRIIFDIENWLWKSEICIFWLLDLERTLIYQKKKIWNSAIFHSISYHLMRRLLKIIRCHLLLLLTYLLRRKKLFAFLYLAGSFGRKSLWDTYNILKGNRKILKLPLKFFNLSLGNFKKEFSHFRILLLFSFYRIFERFSMIPIGSSTDIVSGWRTKCVWFLNA